MPTSVLDAYSKAFPSITNRIRASVYSESDPLAAVATIIDSTVGHPIRIWHFAGLPRDNYIFSLDEIDGSDAVVANLAYFDVVPGMLEGTLSRDDEQIQVDVTPGFTAGTNTAVFDGTAGKPDYIGWEIVPSELTGRGILVKNSLDYTWDKLTGTLALIQIGDVFSTGTYYNIHFNPVNQSAGNSYPTLSDFQIIRVISNTTLASTDFGKKLLIEPNADYIEITLPSDLGTIIQGRPLMVETGDTGSMFCVKIKDTGTIQYLRGNIYMMPNESLTIYVYQHPNRGRELRVFAADGNFKTVGQLVSEDAILADVFNKYPLNGDSLSSSQYARLYNEYVLHLPIGQVCDYDAWTTGDNIYKYSLDNSANPSAQGTFHIPDRRNLYERNNNTGAAGDFQQEQFKAHNHYEVNLYGVFNQLLKKDGLGTTTSEDADGTGREPNLKYSYPMIDAGGDETRPISYLINKYVLL